MSFLIMQTDNDASPKNLNFLAQNRPYAESVTQQHEPEDQNHLMIELIDGSMFAMAIASAVDNLLITTRQLSYMLKKHRLNKFKNCRVSNVISVPPTVNQNAEVVSSTPYMVLLLLPPAYTSSSLHLYQCSSHYKCFF